MLKVLSPVMCMRHSFKEYMPLYLTGHIVCRMKYTRYDLNKIVKMNQENKLLFGPVLKAKDLKPKKRKSSKKTPVVQGISCIIEESKAQNENTEETWMGVASDIARKSVQKATRLNKKDVTLEDSTIPSGESVASLNNVSDSFKASSPHKSSPRNKVQKKELAPSLPVFNFILNFPLEAHVGVDSDACSDFSGQVEHLGLRTVPTVSSILSRTQSDMARFFLQRWREKSIAEMGKEAFYKQLEEIKRDGINLHACVQQYLSGRDVADIQIQPRTQGYWESLQTAFDKIDDVKAVETPVSHPLLQYRGTFDCVAVYRDTLCVIDWKTSQKPKPLLSNTFDNPLQVVAYAGAINASTDMPQLNGPITSAALVIAYPWGEPAHVHIMRPEQCQEYWTQWLIRLNQYWNSVAREKGLHM